PSLRYFPVFKATIVYINVITPTPFLQFFSNNYKICGQLKTEIFLIKFFLNGLIQNFNEFFFGK
ncbi:hypothetical protein ACPTE7_14715, partial [Enterococcus faecalis]|uniref:hypothetical protein n=1 Tax=Enterococcus faecalis TaxID=1351 RepID=UPI003CC6C129